MFSAVQSRLKVMYHYHGTIIRTGITCKKIPCYIRGSACRWFIVKKAKQKQPPAGVPRKRCSENMQQIYRRTPMSNLKSHFGMGVLL